MGFLGFFKSLFDTSHSKTVSFKAKADSKKWNGTPIMRYLLNDPSTPDLIIDRTFNPRPKACLPFTVRGFKGNSTKIETGPWRAAQVYHTYLDVLHTMQPAFRRAPKRWPGTNRLVLLPAAGKDLNAYYDRRRLCFFYDKDPVTDKMIYTSESVDIVAHEMGHALLDAARPRLWNMQALEIWSFHEAWADLVALLTVMKHDAVLEHVLKETNGDFGKSNVISRLGEEMGTAIYHVVGSGHGHKPGRLRDAKNNFIYKAPEKLPKRAPDDKLARESHSFGRVFLGAFYEIMAGIYHQEVANGFDEMEALRKTRHASAMLLAHGAQKAPASPRFYDAVARAILGVDKGHGGKYYNIIKKVFDKRKIISRRSVKAQKSLHLADVEITDNDQVEEYNDMTTITKQSIKTVRLADYFGVRAQANNPLYECELDIPDETYMEFDKKGNLIDSVATSERIAINSARDCISFLHENDMWDSADEHDPEVFEKQFSVTDGKLVRNFFI